MTHENIGNATEPRYIVENLVNEIVPFRPTGLVSRRERRRRERRREDVRDAGYATLSWWGIRGQELCAHYRTNETRRTREDLYDDAYGFVLSTLGIGWIASFFVSWAIKIAVKLMLNWLLSADSAKYRYNADLRKITYGT